MDPEMYSRLFSAALEYDADIVECGNHVFEDSSDRLIEAKRRSPSRHFEENASPASFFRDSIWGKMDICVWSKLFRKSMLDAHRLRFNVHLKSGAEDETFRLMAVPHASRLLFIPDCLYYYRLMRNGSLSAAATFPPTPNACRNSSGCCTLWTTGRNKDGRMKACSLTAFGKSGLFLFPSIPFSIR